MTNWKGLNEYMNQNIDDTEKYFIVWDKIEDFNEGTEEERQEILNEIVYKEV